MKLTLKQLKEMKPDITMGTGTGTYPELHKQEIRWVAVRGEGYHDWTIYYHLTDKSVEFVKSNGDKCFSESVIKRLIPCTHGAYSMYRF